MAEGRRSCPDICSDYSIIPCTSKFISVAISDFYVRIPRHVIEMYCVDMGMCSSCTSSVFCMVVQVCMRIKPFMSLRSAFLLLSQLHSPGKVKSCLETGPFPLRAHLHELINTPVCMTGKTPSFRRMIACSANSCRGKLPICTMI